MGLGLPSVESHRQVGKSGVLDAGALVLESDDLLQLRHDVVGHLVAEALDVLRAVADAVHAHIGKLTVVVIAHDLSLLVQVLDDLGVQLVQLGAVGVEVTGLGLISGPAGGGIGAFLVGAKLGDGELLAVQFHQRTAVDLLVGADEGVVLLLKGHGCARPCPARRFFMPATQVEPKATVRASTWGLARKARLISTLALDTAGPLASKKSCSAFQ